MSTKEKILVAALGLFNERGTDVVTVRHIAQAVGISHGNLCYHYANTDTIIVTLYQQLVERINQAMVRPTQEDRVDLATVEQLIRLTMIALYEYRFLMLDFTGIMRRCPAIWQQHRVLIDHRKGLFRQLLNQLRAQELVRPAFYPDYDDHLLGQVFVLSDFWMASAEWSQQATPAQQLDQYQRVLKALLVPLLTEQGWAEWQRASMTKASNQTNT